MQRADRHAMLSNVCLGAVERPICKRVDFDKAEGLVEGREGGIVARRRLFAPDARDPGRGTGQRSLKRRDLPDMTAGLALFDGVPEAENSIASDGFLDIVSAGHDNANARAEGPFRPRQSLVGFGEMPPGVERDRFDPGMRGHDGVEKNLILQAEAAGKNNSSGNRAFNLPNSAAEIAGAAKQSVERVRKPFQFIVLVQVADWPVHCPVQRWVGGCVRLCADNNIEKHVASGGAEIKICLHFGLLRKKIRIVNPRPSEELFYSRPDTPKVIYSIAAPGSLFAVLIVKAVFTELTFGAAVNSRMMKFWNVTRSGATHFRRKSVSPESM